MSGYTRQSVADIIANAVIKAAPVNAEFNALRDAFALGTGHKHDGTTGEGAYVPLIADLDGNNKVVVDTANNRISVFVEVSGAPVEQLRIQDGVIVPVTDNDIDLGTGTLEFKNLFIDGIAKIDTLTVDENATIAGTLGVTGASTLPTVTISGGTINNTVVGNATPTTVTGTNITATVGLSGTLTGNVTGNLTGNVTGNVTGDVTGNLTGNVTAGSGTSTFNNVTINGSLDMNAGTTATVTGLSTPVNSTDATTKAYVDSADALKLNLSGGTMSGAIAMGTNKITGLGTPTNTADAATKGYVDTSISTLIDSAPGTLDTLNELAAALGDDPNFATTVTNEIATKLPLAGGTMTGDIVLGANKATSTATPVTNDTLTRKGYVDDQVNTRLPLAGGTMSGVIAMGTNKITGLGTPTAGTDATTKTYVDSADALKLDLAGGTMTGNIVMGANKVTSTATPTADDDLTRKAYVDSILGSATAAADSAAAALVSENNALSSANAAASSATDASNSADAAASTYDQFDDRYLGAKASSPTVDNDGDPLLTGALYFDTTADQMRVYTGTTWVAAGSAVNGTSERNVYTATAGQTTFAATYDVGFVDVYLNGVKLTVGTDFTATSGTDIVLASGATEDDVVDIVAYGAFEIANTFTQAQADARFLRATNNLSDLDNLITARQNLGVEIGVDVQAFDSTILNDADIGVTVEAFDATILKSADIGVTVQGYDVDTAKLDVAQTFTQSQTISAELIATSYNETFSAVTSSAGAVTVNCETGNVFSHTLTENTTFTFSNPPATGTAYGFTIKAVQDSTARTITWPASVDWAGGEAPTISAGSGEVDVFVFYTHDGGTTWYGFTAGQVMS
jgi:hypothetical protein